MAMGASELGGTAGPTEPARDSAGIPFVRPYVHVRNQLGNEAALTGEAAPSGGDAPLTRPYVKPLTGDSAAPGGRAAELSKAELPLPARSPDQPPADPLARFDPDLVNLALSTPDVQDANRAARAAANKAETSSALAFASQLDADYAAEVAGAARRDLWQWTAGGTEPGDDFAAALGAAAADLTVREANATTRAEKARVAQAEAAAFADYEQTFAGDVVGARRDELGRFAAQFTKQLDTAYAIMDEDRRAILTQRGY